MQKWGIWQPSNFPSYFWDNEYWQRGTTRSSQSSTSTFEEVESLGYSKSSSQDSFQSDHWRKESPHHPRSDAGSKNLLLTRQSSASLPDRYQHHNNTSSSLSTTDSTFDDFENLDHDVGLPSLSTVLGKQGENAIRNRHLTKNRHKGQKGGLVEIPSCGQKKGGHQWTGGRRNRGKDLIVPDEEVSPYYPAKGDGLGNYNNGVDGTTEKTLANTDTRKVPRDPFEHFFGYRKNFSHKGAPSLSESSIQTSLESFSGSSDQNSRLPYENDYEYHVRIWKNHPRFGYAQRSPSFDSNSSSFTSSSSHGDPQPSAFSMSKNGSLLKSPVTAEQVLMNLGFSGSDSFLPERFARDWYDKMLMSRTYMIQQMQTAEISDMWDSLETTPSTQSSGMSTPWRRGTLDMGSGLRSNRRMRRSNTIGTYHESVLPHQEDLQPSPRRDVEAGTVLVSKQDSIEQLREILEKHANILHSGSDPIRDKRRRQFATSRQISLPLHLETLSEEEEGKSPKPRLNKDGKSFMRSFFEEEQRRSSLATQSSSEMSGDEVKIHGVQQSGNSSEEETNTNAVEDNGTAGFNSKAPSRVPSIIITEKTPDLISQSSESLEIVEINRLSQSGDSLEVDDILNHKGSRRLSAQLEPALLSTVLSDVRRDSSNFLGLPKQGSSQDMGEDRLAPPSPCSSSSLSPIPQSPVTVIEVTLDNQNDSLDTEDGFGLRRDSHDQPDDGVTNIERLKSPVSYLVLPKFKKVCSGANISKPAMHSTSVEVDSGRLSPLVMFHQSVEGDEENHHGDSPVSVNEAEVQADDGRLSPLMKTGEEDLVWKILTDMDLIYQIKDEASQCDFGPSQIPRSVENNSFDRCKTEIKVNLTVPDYSGTVISSDQRQSVIHKPTTFTIATQTADVERVDTSCQTLHTADVASGATLSHYGSRQVTQSPGNTDREALDGSSRSCCSNPRGNSCNCSSARGSSLNETIERLSRKTQQLKGRRSCSGAKWCLSEADGTISSGCQAENGRRLPQFLEPQSNRTSSLGGQLPYPFHFDDTGASSSQLSPGATHSSFGCPNLCVNCHVCPGYYALSSSCPVCQYHSASASTAGNRVADQDPGHLTIHCSQLNIVTENCSCTDAARSSRHSDSMLHRQPENSLMFPVDNPQSNPRPQISGNQNSSQQREQSRTSFPSSNSLFQGVSESLQRLRTERQTREFHRTSSETNIAGMSGVNRSNFDLGYSSVFAAIPLNDSQSADDDNLSDGSISCELSERRRLHHNSGSTSAGRSSASSMSFP